MQITHPAILLAALVLLLCVPIAACRQQINTLPERVQAEPIATAIVANAPNSPPDPQTNPQTDPHPLENQWIVSADEARSLIEQGATLLDTRGGLRIGDIAGAVPISWKDFSPTEPTARGNLLADDAELSERLQAHGISTDRPVVVFGNPPRGWGEEGRIVWMLRSLGHSQAVMVDGGIRALTDVNVPVPVAPETPGRFDIQRNEQWSLDKESLKAQLDADNLVIIDTREPREFAGSTPYGEQRGGHIPGAVHLYFKDLLASDGKLLPQETILNKLADLNITPDQPVVVYCTGGIRSGWLVTVLTTLGIPAQNYAGSTWEWSAAPTNEYPLEIP